MKSIRKFHLSDRAEALLLFLVLGIILFTYVVSHAQITLANDGGGNPSSLSSVIWSWGAPFLVYLTSRILTVQLVIRYMRKRATGVSPALDTPIDEAVEPLRANETQLQFLHLDSRNDVQIEDRLHGRLDRALKTGKRSLQSFWQALFVFLVASLLIWNFMMRPMQEPAGSGLDSETSSGFQESATQITNFLPIILIIGSIVLFFFSLWRYRTLKRLALPSAFVGFLIVAACWIVASVLLKLPFWISLLPPLLAVGVVFWRFQQLYAASRPDGNLQLLVLRVFGADRNTAFLFGELVRKWRHLGSFITLVDPSYIRYRFSLSSPETRTGLSYLVFGYGILVGAVSLAINGIVWLLDVGTHSPVLAAWRSLSWSARNEILSMSAWLVMIPLAVLPVIIIIRRRFIGSDEKLAYRVRAAGGQKLGWNTTFARQTFYCFDNIWRQAVRSLLDVSDAVLMDLRGFSPNRRGCEYELGLLFDQYPIARTVFLVDSGPATAALTDFFQQRWQTIGPDSPNWGLEQPVVRLYTPGDEDEKDLPRIVGLLVLAAGAQPDQSPPIPIEAHERYGRFYQLNQFLRKRMRLGTSIPMAIDMAIAKPRFGTPAAAVLLVMLLAFLSYRVNTLVHLVEAYRPRIIKLVDTQIVSDVDVAKTAIQVSAKGSIAKGWVASRGDKTYSDLIEVLLEVRGGAASTARKVGQVEISSLLSPLGNTMEILDVTSPGEHTDLREHVASVSSDPPDGFRIELELVNPGGLQRIAELKGSVLVQKPVVDKTISIVDIATVIENTKKEANPASSQASAVQLQHDQLDAYGVVSLVRYAYDPDHFFVVVTSQSNQAQRSEGTSFRVSSSNDEEGRVDVSLVMADGSVSGPVSTSRSRTGRTISQTYGFPAITPPGAALELALEYESKRLPFTLVDVTLEEQKP